MDPNSPAVSTAITLFIWFGVGIMVLWMLGTLTQNVARIVTPSLPFIIGAILLGGVAIAAFNKIL